MQWDEQRRSRVICLALGLLTLAVYLPVAGFDFVNYDDSDYVYANDIIKGGISLNNVLWAFTHSHATNWHPLTTLTLMLEYQLFGLNPTAFHLANVLFHVVNSALVFLVLRRLTKEIWPSAVVAALFAWHPAHVESVAWVSELKDVLSTLFWLLTTWAYLRYVETPSRNRYLLTLALFWCGLMSKPMLVTLPCVLLLLDYWPLKRFGNAGPESDAPQEDGSWFGELKSLRALFKANADRWKQLVREKIPFFALVIISCAVTYAVQKEGGAAAPLSDFPLPARVANAVVSYVRYLGMLVWPVDLCIFYPLPREQSVVKSLLAVAFLLFVTALVLRHIRRRAWLGVGWFWFLGTLVPVIGIVQVGNQALADRYTYVPYLGLFIMLAWGIGGCWPECPVRRKVYGALGVAAGALMLGQTAHQIGYWRNSQVLFEHAIAVTENNALAWADLGVAYHQQGRDKDAFDAFKRALDINPNYYHPPFGLGLNLIKIGKYDDAIKILALVAQHRPNDVEVRHNLGIALMKKGRYEDALAHFADVIKLKPKHAEALVNFGLALAALGRVDDAINYFMAGLRENPDSADAHNNLAIAYEAKGKIPEAIEQYTLAVKLAPDLAEALSNLGVLLAKQGRFDLAAPHFTRLIALQPHDPQAQFYYGLTLLNEQQTGPALAHLREAIRLRPDWPSALQTLARILATFPDPIMRNGAEAVQLAERGCELTKNEDALMLDTLAAAYAEAGRFAEAVKTAESAQQRAQAAGQAGLVKQIGERLELYRQQKPFHQE